MKAGLNGKLEPRIKQLIGEPREGESAIVKVHFLPKTSQSERANDPSLVSEEEKNQIAIDAITGFLSMAEALKNDELDIDTKDNDYYLFAQTNVELARFLKQRCNFRGVRNTNKVWLKKSEFLSEETQKIMHDSLEVMIKIRKRADQKI